MAFYVRKQFLDRLRFWAARELQQVRRLQLRLTRRALQMWPRQEQGMVGYLKRTAHECEAWREVAGVRRWDHAIVSL